MSSKEIKELRKAGKLDEAHEVLKQVMASDPENIWNKRAGAWVYYDYLKKYSHPESIDLFIEYLQKIRDLKIPEDDNMIFDNSAWQIGKLLFSIQKQDSVDYRRINEFLDTIKEFHFTKPSEGYTFIYKAFHKGYQNWSSYLAFADWWDFDNFRPEDYLNEEFNGRKTMSVVEQAYIAYSKKLLEGEPIDPFGQQRAIDEIKIKAFLHSLDKIIGEQPKYQYPPYFKAKLLLALGDKDNVLSSFLPFAKQKKNDYWVWSLMAEIFSDDIEIQFACYCKALSLKTQEDFLVKLRQNFADMLVQKQMYNEAKFEIQKVISTKEKQGWKLTKKVTDWSDQDWFKSAKSKKDNKDLYSQHINRAEELLFQDIEEEIIAVEFVNKNKSILNFVKNKQKYGFFNYSGQLNKPQAGEILKVRFNGDGQNGFYKVLSAKKAEQNSNCDSFKNFNGNLKVISPYNFGFVEDVFISPQLILNYNANNGDLLNGKAILSFNKKKQEWGWKAVKIM